MEKHPDTGTRPKKPFKLSSREPSETLTRDTPRFHTFVIDTGWNVPVSNLLHSQFPLFHAYHPKDPLYLGYFGLEVNRRRKKLRAIFDVVDKRESPIAELLEEMVESGELKPFAWADRA
jgi:hypothetical protein